MLLNPGIVKKKNTQLKTDYFVSPPHLFFKIQIKFSKKSSVVSPKETARYAKYQTVHASNTTKDTTKWLEQLIVQEKMEKGRYKRGEKGRSIQVIREKGRKLGGKT